MMGYLLASVFIVEQIGLLRMLLTPFTMFSRIPMLLILRHMWFSEFSVKLSRLCPSLVSLYTFLGLSLLRSHLLFM